MPVKQEDNSSPTASPLIDFTDQSATFLNQLATRKSKPVAAATLATWRSFIRTWIVPRIGNVELATFENLQLKDFADSMHQSGAKPGLISDVVALVKRIIKSARDSQGKRLFVRDWDSEFIDLPEVPPPDTYMPDAKTLQKAIRDADTNKVLQAMIVFAAGTGVRIGEILACRIGPDDGQHTTWDPVTAIIYVNSSLFRHVEQGPKTKSAIRQVDVARTLNEFLVRYAAGRTESTFLFPGRNGRASHDSSARAQLEKLGIPGWHGFRRWRVTQIRKISAPIDLENFWIGHTDGSMGAHYSKVREDLELRRKWVDHIGLGFKLPELRNPERPAPHVGSAPKPVVTPALAKSAASANISTDIQRPYVAEDGDLDEFFHSTPELVPEEV